MSTSCILLMALAWLAGLLVGHYFGYKHGWEDVLDHLAQYIHQRMIARYGTDYEKNDPTAP